MQNIEQEIAAMMEEICEESSEIIAEEGTEYFKERFTEKEWGGTPWPPAKSPKRSGSLLVRSSALLNSIRPTEVTKDRVVITAGNQKVTYAQVHNEGFSGKVNVDAFTRNVKGKTQQVRARTRNTTIPKRQFMGETEELDERILGRIETLIQSKL
jgi:phage gpG-like protein